MYALENIKKFVKDNTERLSDRSEGILKRAKAVSHDGLISGSSIEEILQDNILISDFHKAAVTPEHMEIGFAAIRAIR